MAANTVPSARKRRREAPDAQHGATMRRWGRLLGRGVPESRRHSAMMHAYADDSANATDAIYAAVVLPDRLCKVALSRLADFKNSLHVPNSAELHCRVLFHGSKRTRSEWADVDLKRVESLLPELCQGLRRVCEPPVSASMPFQGPPAPRLGDQHPMGISEVKGVATIGYMAIHQQLLDRFGTAGVRLWI
jgi:hypothetical protein